MNYCNRFVFAFSLVFLVSASPRSFGKSCEVTVDESTLKLNWTAFKTTEKLAVNGSFPSVKLERGGKSKFKDFADFLAGQKIEISIQDARSISTGNPARDQTLYEHFFSKFKDSTLILGEIKNVKSKGAEGSFDLKIRMNRKTQLVPLTYSLSPEGAFEANGGFDLLKFALNAPFEELHQTCEKLHTGPDGVSKTWSTVELKVLAHVTQKCDS